MAAKKKGDDRARRPRSAASEPGIGIRRVEGDEAYEFVHPRCARQRADDIEEVRTMLAAGEIEIAEEELRWLLDGCQTLLEAHKLLGDIALGEKDFALARGHFGYAYQLGSEALPEDRPCRLPYARPANRAFLEAAKGLACCLHAEGEAALAAEVIGRILALDPADPLKVKDVLTAGESP